ncbi:MAG: flavin reductase family protein [Rhodobacteraceae bacterium]|nr:flavin reductase family protein [Paracoccaceae bacterium]
MSEHEFIPGPENGRAFRDALGCYGTGVTIVTAMTDDGPLGMTANSFASLSMDPPLVLWSPAKTSRRYDGFARAERFCIHVVADTQQTLANHFARQGHGFDKVEWHPSEDGTPILEGVLARFECRQVALHDGGDHGLIIGHVLRAAHRPGQGLMFKRGQYGGFSGG